MSTILTLFFALLLVAPKAQPQPSPTDELFSRTHVLRPLAEGFAVAGTTGGLAFYSVSSVGDLALVGRLVLPSAVRDLQVHEGLVFAALGPQGLAVVDASKPEKPALVTRLATDRAINLLTLQGHLLHAACGTLGVTVFDLARPRKPKVAKTLALPGLAGRPFVDGDRVLVPAAGLCSYTADAKEATCIPGPRVDTVFRLGGRLFASSGLALCPLPALWATLPHRGGQGDAGTGHLDAAPLNFDAPNCVKLQDRLRAALPLDNQSALLAASPTNCPKLTLAAPSPEGEGREGATPAKSQDPSPEGTASVRSQDPSPEGAASAKSQDPSPEGAASAKSQDPSPEGEGREGALRLSAGPTTAGTCVNLDATATLLFLATDAGGPKVLPRHQDSPAGAR